MPQVLSVTIPDIVTNVIHPTVRQTVNKVMHDLAITNVFKNRIFYKGDGMVSSRSVGQSDNGVLLTHNKAHVKYTTVMDPLDQASEPRNRDSLKRKYSMNMINDQKAFYFDSDTGTLAECYKLPTELSMEINLKFKDRSVAYQAYSRLIHQYTWGGMQQLQDYIYTYPLTETVYAMLHNIHIMKGNTLDTMYEQLAIDSDNNISLDVNRKDQTQMNLSVRDNTCRVMAFFSKSNGVPEGVRDNDKAKSYDITFSIKLQFDRPDTIFLSYPIIVNNTMVPKDMIFKKRDESYYNYTPIHRYLHFYNVNGIFNKVKEESIVRLPWYDDWNPPASPLLNTGYVPFLIAAITLDDVDNPEGVTYINLLDNLGGVSLDPEIRGYMLEASNITNMSAYINVTLYSNDYIISPDKYSCENGVITIPHRDLTKVYRLVVSEYRDKDTSPTNENSEVMHSAYAPINSWLEPGVVPPVKYIKYTQLDGCLVKYILDANDYLWVFIITLVGVFKQDEDGTYKTVIRPGTNEPLYYDLSFANLPADSGLARLKGPDGNFIASIDENGNTIPWTVKVTGNNGRLIGTNQQRAVSTNELVDTRKFKLTRKGVRYGHSNIRRVFVNTIET